MLKHSVLEMCLHQKCGRAITWHKIFGAIWRTLPVRDELAKLSDEDRQSALKRFQLLQPHLERKRPLRQVATEAGIAFRTAQRWVAQYQQFGLAALARKKRIEAALAGRLLKN